MDTYTERYKIEHAHLIHYCAECADDRMIDPDNIIKPLPGTSCADCGEVEEGD